MSHVLDRWKLSYGKGLTLPRLHRWRKELELDRVKLREQEFSLMPVGGYYEEVKEQLADVEEVLGSPQAGGVAPGGEDTDRGSSEEGQGADAKA